MEIKDIIGGDTLITEIIRMNWYWFIIIGFAAGVLSGSLGVGAGILVVPALVIGLGFEQKTAQGTCLAVMVPMALGAFARYHFNPDIKLNMSVILFLVPFALIGALIGSGLAAKLPASALRKMFGAFVIIVGIKMLFMQSPTVSLNDNEQRIQDRGGEMQE
jgi:uncharacterized membrane protein YfcA